THWFSLPSSARVPRAGDDFPPSRTFPVFENSSEVRFGETPKARAGLALARETRARPGMIRATLYFSFMSHPDECSPQKRPPAWRGARLTRAPPNGGRAPGGKPPVERQPPIPLAATKSSSRYPPPRPHRGRP